MIVLSGLKNPLRAYDSFDLILVFEKAGEVKLDVLVEDAQRQRYRKRISSQSLRSLVHMTLGSAVSRDGSATAPP